VILFAQPLFWQALLTSLYFAAVMVPAATLLSLGLALLLREGIRSRRGGAAFHGVSAACDARRGDLHHLDLAV